jgi:hypothetical protein
MVLVLNGGRRGPVKIIMIASDLAVNGTARAAPGHPSKTGARARKKKPRSAARLRSLKQGGVKQSGGAPLGAIRSRITGLTITVNSLPQP